MCINQKQIIPFIVGLAPKSIKLKLITYRAVVPFSQFFSSIQDALSSILVARDGFGDMAVSNAIGSNVFDINLGIGLPFIIKSALNHGAPVYLLNEEALVSVLLNAQIKEGMTIIIT